MVSVVVSVFVSMCVGDEPATEERTLLLHVKEQVKTGKPSCIVESSGALVTNVTNVHSTTIVTGKPSSIVQVALWSQVESSGALCH